MKNLTLMLALAVTFALGSCGADDATVDKMAGEMCDAMALYDAEDISSMMAAAEKMTEIAGNSDYGSVTEAQLKGAMETKCADGFKKFSELTESGE